MISTLSEKIAEQAIVNSSLFSPILRSKIIEKWLSLSTTILFLSGFSFVIFSFYFRLKENFSTILSTGLTGAVLLILGTVNAFVLFLFLQNKKKKMVRLEYEWNALVPEVLKIFEQDVSAYIYNNPKTAILLATIAGFLTRNARD